MELQDRVTVVLTKHGANVLNKQNKEYNDKFPKAERRRTDYVVGELLSDHLFNIINTFKDHFNPGSCVCFINIMPEIKGIQEGKWRVIGKLENLKLEQQDKLNLVSEHIERLGVTFKGDKMIMGPVKLTAENPNLTRGKHGDIQVKICTGVFSNGKLVSIFEGQPTPVNIPAEKEDPDESVSMEEYDMMSNAYKEAFDKCTRLKDKLTRIQELIKDK